ncbi:phage recombination protein Bet [Streptomyces sp. NPDC050560]|uniref:phage recombination protein Bet n=1 Tax=Streptomyces sp. NPDC050560 TaxID=3365630 RepID=UPI003797F2CE
MSTEIVQTGGALAIRPDQTVWTPEQAAVLRQSGIGDGVTHAELSSFLHLCQRTGLDPFSRQIYLIGRWDKRAGREVFTPQTGIDGYRVVAQRVTVKQGGAYGYEDTLWCDASGAWRDVWLAEEPPAAAKVTVVRNGQRFSAVALFREYVQTNRDGRPVGSWGKMPAGQLAKCGEALALRKAFPLDLAGVYTAEEMAQADNPAPAGVEPEPVERMRRAQPGEPDPWATPAPEPQTAAQGRDYLHEAHQAPDRDAVRRIWLEARADGAVADYLAQIAAVGKDKAASTKPTPAQDPAPATAEDDAITAERELRAAAKRVHLTNLDEEFEQSYGLPIAQAPAAQMRQMTAILIGTAAA